MRFHSHSMSLHNAGAVSHGHRRGALFLAITLILSMVGCDDDSDTTDPGPVLSPTELAFAALGGREAIQGMTSLSFTAAGETWAIDQASTPDELEEGNQFVMRLEYLPEGRRFRLEHERTIAYPFAVTRTFTQIFDGDAGYTEGDEGLPFVFPDGDMLPNKAAAHLVLLSVMSPEVLFRRIADGEITSKDAGTETRDGRTYSLVAVQLGSIPVTARIDVESGDLVGVSFTVHDTLLCDVELEVRYEKWTEVGGGLRVPLHVTLSGAQGALYEETRSQIAVSKPIDASRFELPADATRPLDVAAAAIGEKRLLFHNLMSSLGVPFLLPQNEVTAIPLAPGITFLQASHNSVVVEQVDRVVLIEAPLDRERSQAITAWVGMTYPDKPLSHVIATHYHFDHAAGLRQFVAQGATVVIGQESVEFFKDRVFGATCSVYPDDLQVSPRPATIEPVPAGGMLRLDDPANPIEVHRIQSGHAFDMSIVYLPEQHIVFNSDLYNPLPPQLDGLGLQPYLSAQDFRDFMAGITSAGITPAVVVGGHGAVTTMDRVQADFAALP